MGTSLSLSSRLCAVTVISSNPELDDDVEVCAPEVMLVHDRMTAIAAGTAGRNLM